VGRSDVGVKYGKKWLLDVEIVNFVWEVRYVG
jgi:hypothetical protein